MLSVRAILPIVRTGKLIDKAFGVIAIRMRFWTLFKNDDASMYVNADYVVFIPTPLSPLGLASGSLAQLNKQWVHV